MKTEVIMFAIGFACAGCHTYPFIDESLAQIEAAPLSANFPPPEHELVGVPDQESEENLLGTWTASYIEYVRIIDGKSPHPFFDYHDMRWPVTDSYTFSKDGTYVRHECVRRRFQMQENVQNICYNGKWSYRAGVLTLMQEKMVIKPQGLGFLNPVVFGDDSTVINGYKVEWFEGNEIILRDVDTLKDIGENRITVNVDGSGVRIERTICPHGSENGRERGEIQETATLVRFRKTL